MIVLIKKKRFLWVKKLCVCIYVLPKFGKYRYHYIIQTKFVAYREGKTLKSACNLSQLFLQRNTPLEVEIFR